MSGFSLSISRPGGRALIVGSAGCRASLVEAVSRAGFQAAEAENPYAAMAEICRRPLAYRALVVSLASMYPEELELIAAVKRRYGHVEIWLAHTDGRPAALAETLRMGADGLLSEDGLHRLSTAPTEAAEPAPPACEDSSAAESASAGPESGSSEACPATHQERSFPDNPSGEPILTAEELRALLEDPPARSTPTQED